ATAATVVATSATTAAAGTFFAGPGDIHREGATIQFLAVQAVDGLLGFLGGTHGNETKAAGAIGRAIHHQVGFSDRAKRGERVLQVVFCRVEGKVSNKQFAAHILTVP